MHFQLYIFAPLYDLKTERKRSLEVGGAAAPGNGENTVQKTEKTTAQKTVKNGPPTLGDREKQGELGF